MWYLMTETMLVALKGVKSYNEAVAYVDSMFLGDYALGYKE